MKLGDLLRVWRTVEGLTIQKMADDLDLPYETYRRVESGEQMQLRTWAKLFTWLMRE